jgi:RHS repeat-associated protein
VNQSGQTRGFVYDSLGRLTCSYQPEMVAPGAVQTAPDRNCTFAGQSNTQGLAIVNLYDSHGNLTSRTDARGAAVSYSYDPLSRKKYTTYSGLPNQNAPNVTYCYDGYQVSGPGQCFLPSSTAPYSHGQLTHMSSSAASTLYTGFDVFGNATGMQQMVGAFGPYPFSYTHNLGGKLSSMTYPSGRILNVTFDSAGREAGLTGTKGPAVTTYVNSAAYWAHGGLRTMGFGNNTLTESRTFNAQLLPTGISAASSSASLALGSTYYANANLNTQSTNTGSATYSQSYGYDGVNRLTFASEGNGWTQTYCYDAWGNRVVTGGAVSGNMTPTGSSCAPGLSPYSNNHWSGAPTDLAGNVTSDGLSTLTYDSENRIVQSTSSRGTVTYAYDGDGKRVQKTGPNGITVYVYDADGSVAAEYATQVQSSTCTPCYVTQDPLGSVRMVTNSSGSVVRRHDFFPFGEEIPQGTNARPWPVYQTGQEQTLPDFLNWKFTGVERDAETTLDLMSARSVNGAQGRFLSPDEPLVFADPGNPQTWNLYHYALNNPLMYTDPTGHEDCVDGVNPDNRNICTVGTAKSPKVKPVESSNSNTLGAFLLDTLVRTTAQVASTTVQIGGAVMDWLAKPRDQNCLNAFTASGAMIGEGVGMLGIAGGPTVFVTEGGGVHLSVAALDGSAE